MNFCVKVTGWSRGPSQYLPASESRAEGWRSNLKALSHYLLLLWEKLGLTFQLGNSFSSFRASGALKRRPHDATIEGPGAGMVHWSPTLFLIKTHSVLSFIDRAPVPETHQLKWKVAKLSGSP